VDVRNYVAKDLIVDIPANFSVMPKPVIELLGVESHAREGGLNVDTDVLNDARTHVETATSPSKTSIYRVVIVSPNLHVAKFRISGSRSLNATLESNERYPNAAMKLTWNVGSLQMTSSAK
jgi:hypothetical protein